MIKRSLLHCYILLLAWILVQCSLWLIQGVRIDLEATKYISQANNLLSNGYYSAPKYLFYSTQILITAFFLKLNLGYWSIALFQILLNGFATIVLFKFSRNVTKSTVVAFITTLLFILFYPLQTWNTFLYTESIFISLSICFIYTIYNYPPSSIKKFFIGVIFLAILTITRPFGVLFIIPFLLYALLISNTKFRIILSFIFLVGILSFFYLVNYAFKGGEDMDALKPFKEEHVVCFIPSANPEPLEVRTSENPISDIFYYIFHNPRHFAILVVKRLISFFILTKPYFSFIHNVYLIIIIIPIYIFALFAYLKNLITASIIKFLLILLLIYSLGVTFQCNDYHNRFIMPLFFIIFLFSGAGINYFFEKYIKERTKRI